MVLNNNQGFTVNQSVENKIRRRLLAVIVIMVLVFAVILWLIMSIRGSNDTLLVSDVVMQNVSNLDILSGKKFNFNTGSAISSVDLFNVGEHKSINATTDTPYSRIFKIDYRESTSTMLAQILYTKEDLYSVNKLKKPLSGPQQIWITQGKTGGPTLLNPFGNTKKILDAKFSSSEIIMLVGEGNQNSLYSFGVSPRQLSQNIPDNQLIAITNNQIVAREQTGKTNVYDLSGKKLYTLNSGNEKVLVDKETNSIVWAQEGKFVVKSGDKKSEFRTESGAGVFISSGHLITIDSLVLPKQMTVTSLENKKQRKYNLSFRNSAITESIVGIVSPPGKTSNFGLITETSSLLLASTDSKFIDGVQKYQFPDFKNTELVNYNLGTNEAIIYTTNISESIALASQDCSCDLNQIRKFWQKSFDTNPYQPNPAEPEEGEEENF